jgi:adenylate cyclase
VDSLNHVESWLVQAGLASASETESLDGFCDRCRGAGIDSRTTLVVDTLHPIYEVARFVGGRQQRAADGRRIRAFERR